MLRSANEITGYVLAAEDGEIGRCKDFLFDDREWVIRYMVADTRKWLPGRKVLISPMSLEQPDWSARKFPVHLTKERVKESPSLDEDQPVARQHEKDLHLFYGYPFYWVGTDLWGTAATPSALRDAARTRLMEEPEPDGDPHLRSLDEIDGYHIAARDGEVGHVEDLILDDESWVVRYLVVDTRNWLPGRKVLIPPPWVEDFEWLEEKARVDLTQDQIENSPEFDPDTPVNRDYESRLYDYYGRPVYWK